MALVTFYNISYMAAKVLSKSPQLFRRFEIRTRNKQIDRKNWKLSYFVNRYVFILLCYIYIIIISNIEFGSRHLSFIYLYRLKFIFEFSEYAYFKIKFRLGNNCIMGII